MQLPKGYSINYPPPAATFEVYQCPVTKKFLDPFRTYTALQFYAGGGKKFNELVRKQADPQALMQLADVGRKAFGVTPVDAATGQGTPDAVILAAVEKFVEYVLGKGKGAGNWRNWLPSSASPPSSAPKNCLDCG